MAKLTEVFTKQEQRDIITACRILLNENEWNIDKTEQALRKSLESTSEIHNVEGAYNFFCGVIETLIKIGYTKAESNTNSAN